MRISIVGCWLVLIPLIFSPGCRCQKPERKEGTDASTDKSAPTNQTASAVQAKPDLKKFEGAKELEIKDTVKGTGKEANIGDKVFVHYTGRLTNGTKFDSSRDRGEPYDFVLGSQNVIKGWDKGVQGMKVGGKRQLIIPPSLAYGAQGAGSVIPPNAVLVFEIELVNVQPKKTTP